MLLWCAMTFPVCSVAIPPPGPCRPSCQRYTHNRTRPNQGASLLAGALTFLPGLAHSGSRLPVQCLPLEEMPVDGIERGLGSRCQRVVPHKAGAQELFLTSRIPDGHGDEDDRLLPHRDGLHEI